MSDRGWGQSCGAADLQKLLPACAAGYNHLMDDRYEVRDAQYLIGELADEGVAEPQRIGATGESYGGGISMALAALRNRVMMPDGSLVPWVSPDGKPMEIAAAVPQWPWSDLAYALAPNGTTLDYAADSPYRGPTGDAPIGIEKLSFVSSLLGLGAALSNFSLTDPEAAVPTWYARLNVGEPYDGDPTAESIFEQVTTYHSSYYINHAEPPAPLLIQSGWNDDLFPPDEAIRYYNRTRTQFPENPISLFFMDDGHMRSQNKEADVAVFRAREQAWFDYYLKGVGTAPGASAEALTTTCPSTAASEGPYRAADWRDLSPGEIRMQSPAAQTIVPAQRRNGRGHGIRSDRGRWHRPPAPAPPAPMRPASPTTACPLRRAPASPCSGSPTIIADLATTGTESELAARLVDVSPAGTETLIARGLLRPGAGGHTVFQLHPQAYRFAPGDVPKLELLPSDAPYARPVERPGTDHRLEPRTAPAGPRPAGLARRHRPGAAAPGRPTRLRTGERLPRRCEHRFRRRHGRGRRRGQDPARPRPHRRDPQEAAAAAPLRRRGCLQRSRRRQRQGARQLQDAAPSAARPTRLANGGKKRSQPRPHQGGPPVRRRPPRRRPSRGVPRPARLRRLRSPDPVPADPQAAPAGAEIRVVFSKVSVASYGRRAGPRPI